MRRESRDLRECAGELIVRQSFVVLVAQEPIARPIARRFQNIKLHLPFESAENVKVEFVVKLNALAILRNFRLLPLPRGSAPLSESQIAVSRSGYPDGEGTARIFGI